MMRNAAAPRGDGGRKSKSVIRGPIDTSPPRSCQSNRNRGYPAERVLFRLCPGWAIGADGLQWLLYRVLYKRDSLRFKPKAYIATTKNILLRVLRENGIEPDAEGRAALDAMPDTFKEFRSLPQADSGRRLDG